jgi:hypothetical protein
MTADQQNWVEGQKMWIAGQKNNAAQLEANLVYDIREIQFHQQAIENNARMLAHYQKGITAAEAFLEQYIKDNQD